MSAHEKFSLPPRRHQVKRAFDPLTPALSPRERGRKTVLSSTALILLCALAGVISPPISNAENAFDQEAMFRPFAGVGFTSGADLGDGDTGSGLGYHLGARLMWSANSSQKYGLEATYLDLYGLEDDAADVRYAALGIVLEQSLLDNQLMLSIGTLGYIGIGDNDDNPFGLRTNIGWEGGEPSGLRPFVIWRADYIFDAETLSSHSISAGVRLEF